MNVREVEQIGATVDEAVEQALRALGVPREAVHVDVLDLGSRGVLGLGARPARVVVRVLEGVAVSPAVEEAAERAAASGEAAPVRGEVVPGKGMATETRPGGSGAAVGGVRPVEETPVAPGALQFGGAPLVSALREDPVGVTREIVTGMLKYMGYRASVHVQQRPEAVQVSIRGDNLGALIGRRGQTLDAMEFLVGLMVSRRTGSHGRVEVDVGGYRERRRRALEDVARRAAERATQEGRQVSLEPMDARERRIVHLALKSHPGVHTFSQGEGPLRYVVVAPRREGAQRPAAEPDENRDPGAAGEMV